MNPQPATKTIARQNNSQLAQSLRDEAKKNPVLNAMCHVFAIRERARQQITISSLMLRMSHEGYKYPRQEYIKCLRFLADLGIGQLDINPKTQEVRSLKNIRLTLQSVGKAAVGTQNEKLETFNPSFDYKELTAPPIEAAQIVPTKPEPGQDIPKPDKRPARLPHPQYAVRLTVDFDGTVVDFPLPKGLTTKELMDLLADINNQRMSNS